MGEPSDIDRLIELGLNRYGAGDLDGALLMWEEALAIDPGNAQANSYVDYVRLNYELLTVGGPSVEDHDAPFAIEEEPEYLIEIIPGRPSDPSVPADITLPPAAALMSLDSIDAGWDIEETHDTSAVAPDPAASADDEPLELELEPPRPRDPINFEDATREYHGVVQRSAAPILARPGDFSTTEPTHGEFNSDEHTGGFSGPTEIRKRDLGFVQPTANHTKSTDFEPTQERGPRYETQDHAARYETQDTGRRYDGDATETGDDLIDSLPTPRPATGPSEARDPEPPALGGLGLGLDRGSRATGPSEARDPEPPALGGLGLGLDRGSRATGPSEARDPEPPALGGLGLGLDRGSRATSPSEARDPEPPALGGLGLGLDRGSRATGPSEARDPEPPALGGLGLGLDRGSRATGPSKARDPEPESGEIRLPGKAQTRDMPQVQRIPARPETAHSQAEVMLPHTQTREMSPNEIRARALEPMLSAPTRELGLRPIKGMALDDDDVPTGQSDVRAIRAAAAREDGRASRPGTEGTRHDIVLSFDPIAAQAAQILDDVDASAAPGESHEETTRRRITRLLELAGDWSEAGQLDKAVSAVDLALSEDPNSALGQKLITRNKDTIMHLFQAYLGDLDRMPQLARPLHELSNAPISPRAAFLLSRIDGALTIDELLDVSGMPRLEAYRHLCQLFLRGILR